MTARDVSPAPRVSLAKRLVFALAMTVVAGAAAVCIAEVVFRFASDRRYATPAMLRQRTLEYAPSLFARHVFPRQELHASNEDENNWVAYYINEKGYRGRNFDVAKPAGAIRIIFYGGSVTFDVNLPEGRDWPHRVETILRESGYPQVEVINAGIPGHASWDSFGRLFAEGHHFSPDYVISINGWNDFRYFRSDQPLLREFQPLARSSRLSDPRLNYRNALDRLLSERSQLFLRLRARYYDWRLGIGALGVAAGGTYSSDVTDAALRLYYLNQVMIVDFTREIGAVPILMTEPRLTSSDNTASQKARVAPFFSYVKLDHEGLLKAYAGIEGVLRRISAERKVELIDLASVVHGKDDFFTDVAHLTPSGSEALAQLTARRLMSLLQATHK